MPSIEQAPIRARLTNGKEIRVEATYLGGVQKTGILGNIDFSEVTETLASIASDVMNAVDAIKPQKATVELGVEVAVEAGKLVALLCQGSGKANIKLALEWGAAHSA
jgi:hypothetical protein